jgi:GntR family transcriptional repressor for pyruvate dehydrogenase complex
MRDVDDQELGPGASIGSEAAMLSEYAVSRSTLREATRLLTFLGATETRAGPGGGLVRRQPDIAVLASALAMVLQHRQATYHSILDALAGLEPAGAAMAAARHRESDIVTLRAAADRFDRNSGVETRKAFFQFDYALGEATHDDVFNVVWTAVVQLSSVPQLHIPERISTGLAASHHEIVDAVEIGDSDAARGLMVIHRKELADWLRVDCAELLSSPIRWADVDEQLELLPDPP